MSILRSTYDLIDVGRSDHIIAIPTGIEKIDDYVYGTRQGVYYLYGADTGVGKTTFVREKHMHQVYDFFKQVNDTKQLDLMFVDFSLEISPEINMAAAISRKLYLDQNVVLSVEQILGWNKKKHGKLSDEAVRLIHSYDSYFRDFENRLLVSDDEVTPQKFHDTLLYVAKQHGKFLKENRNIASCEGYIPNNPRKYVIVIVDTVNLIDQEPGSQVLKASIDKISRTAVWFRNKCNFIPIFIQQFNADNSDIDRMKFGATSPMLRDFEDSKRLTKDANVVFGLYDPIRHHLEKFAGYDIIKMNGRFRSAHLLKNRNGQSNKIIPMDFYGQVGVFTQLYQQPEVVTN